MEISNFNELVAAARSQPERQRLLFVFAQPVLPKDATEDEKQRFQEGSGGGLQPLMSVDKRPEDLTAFESLVAEADAQNPNWKIVFIASLSGQNGGEPATADVDQAIELMIKSIHAGGDVDRFVVFDRSGAPLRLDLQ